MLKEKAEEKYDNSFYLGNTGFLGEYDDYERKSYSINVGNLVSDIIQDIILPMVRKPKDPPLVFLGKLL